MNVAIITTMIAAFASVLTCFLGIKAGRVRLFSPYQKEYLERQIFEFLAPTDQLLTFCTTSDWKNVRCNLESLISENYALVPPLILDECVPLIPCDEITYSQLSKLQTVVSSVYHWTRREAGHSYDRTKIEKEFVPENEFIKKCMTMMTFLVILATISLFLFLIFIRLKDKKDLNWDAIFAMIGFYVLFAAWMFLLRSVRR